MKLREFSLLLLSCQPEGQLVIFLTDRLGVQVKRVLLNRSLHLLKMIRIVNEFLDNRDRTSRPLHRVNPLPSHSSHTHQAKVSLPWPSALIPL